jgi:NADH:ubiquinone oxidoreductase subunit H
MIEYMPIFLNSKFASLLFTIFFGGVFLTIGLDLWDKVKFPFTWRKVWAVFFLVLAIRWISGPFLIHQLR